jgi:hypothetical protein
MHGFDVEHPLLEQRFQELTSGELKGQIRRQ